ncbi:MAG: Mur ligase family protein [Roseburia sp.]|nr:Mur ligase family protein [Anaeroplasma bactoclasticum]MCM1196059.1 Mur ligase family protein [Roseburia sp.]MCM1556744.1 Mur ligase family protein [Anaeroplasma bactoclasticum]
MIISVLLYALCKLYLVLNIYQQSHYQFKLYLKHFVYNLIFYDLFPCIVLVLGMLQNEFIIILICSIYLCLFSIFYLIARVKLKFTKRMLRMLILSILYLGIGFIPYIGVYLLLFLEFTILPVLCLERGIAYLLNRPYICKAKEKLRVYRGKKIAITGSFGKTSTKVLLNQALNLFYSSAATPKSYNTELGISRFINDIPDLNIFEDIVLEFGASHKKDIKKLKEITEPDVCFVTGIGYMHVETFGSIEEIIKEKMSLLEGCRIAVLNYDCSFIREYPISFNIDIISYGLNNGTYQARNIINQEFDFYKNEKFLAHFKTNLVGRHQILNLTGVLAYLYEQDCDLSVLERGTLSFTAEKNRLEVKKMNTYTLLDDSFNSNYQGFIEALNILKNHPNKRVLLTPGMVELGKYKKELFSSLIEYIVSSTDIVILIGFYQTNGLYRKLKSYNKEVYLVRNFMEGYHLFLTFEKSYMDSMLLIENDVPDLYRVGLI